MARSQLAIQPSVEALAPELDLNAQLAKVIEVEEIFNNCFIPTDHASEYFRWLDELRILKQCGRVTLFCHFPSILNKRIKRKNSLQVSRAMDVELQILKHLARDAHSTVALVDEYCAEYKDLFKEVRNYECFKYLHLGIISPIKRKSLPEIAKVVSINSAQSLDHFIAYSNWSVKKLKSRILKKLILH